MKQGDIYWIDLNPTRGHEQKGKRPAVIISGNAMNDNLGIFIVCPISTKIKNYAGCLVLGRNKINNLSSDSEVLTFQIRTVAKERLTKKIGEVTNNELRAIISLLNEIFIY